MPSPSGPERLGRRQVPVVTVVGDIRPPVPHDEDVAGGAVPVVATLVVAVVLAGRDADVVANRAEEDGHATCATPQVPVLTRVRPVAAVGVVVNPAPGTGPALCLDMAVGGRAGAFPSRLNTSPGLVAPRLVVVVVRPPVHGVTPALAGPIVEVRARPSALATVDIRAILARVGGPASRPPRATAAARPLRPPRPSHAPS